MGETFLESHGLATALVVATVLVAALAEWLVTQKGGRRLVPGVW